MAKRKLTTEILDTIELCAADYYTLDEIREEVDITRSLMEDSQVVASIKRGQIQLLIDIVIADGDLEHFLFITGKTQAELDDMIQVNFDSIEKRRSKILEEEQELKQKQKTFSRRIMNPAGLSAGNVLCQVPENERDQMSVKVLRDEIHTIAQKIKDGDTTLLLELLVGNAQQLHLFNGYVTQNLMGDLGKQLDNFEKLSNMQLKIMQETRKSIMAINEITNPKRTTFIKEANHHNHLHQNSEKKDENKNELQKPERLEEIETFSEAEITPLKEK